VRVASAISNLAAHGSFQCRLVASNAAGVKYGAAQLFTTGNRVGTWGNYPPAFSGFPAGLSNIVAVACGAVDSLALGTDGRVVAWGADNTFGLTNVPGNLSNVIAVAAGYGDGLALLADGTITTWGQYFDGSNWHPMYVPPGLSNVVALAGGANHAVALRADGTIAVWGDNYDGQFNVPPGLSNVVAVAAGDFHSLALLADGHVVAWGGNYSGQTNVPPGLANIVGVTAGSAHSLALRADGTVNVWGDYNGYISAIPPGLSDIIFAVSGSDDTLAVFGSGAVIAWGRDDYGQADVPPGLTNVTGLAAGYLNSVVLGDNTPPRALAGTFSGVANQDLVIGLSASDINFDSCSVRVSTLPAAGALYQYNGGVRGAPIVAPGTQVSDPSGKVIFAPATDTVGSPYSISSPMTA
jgi:hypothetical protein